MRAWGVSSATGYYYTQKERSSPREGSGVTCAAQATDILREYLDQEEGRKRRTEEGRSSSPNDLFARLPRREILRTSPMPNSRKSIYNILHMRPPYVGGETRYPRTDTENRSPCLVALDRDTPPRIREGEGSAV